MNIRWKTVLTTALSVVSITALSAVVGGASVTASDLPDRVQTELLPQAVIDAAVEEQKSIPERIYVPEMKASSVALNSDALDEEAHVSQPKASSLAELVSRRAGTAMADRNGHCLAAAVYFESKGEPLQGQLAVADVILNRTRSGRFPSSVCGVVMQPSQFSFVRGGGFPPIARNGQQWREAVAIAKIAQNSEWSSGIGKALFFHARYVSPGWRLQRVAAVGNHIFYR